MWLVRFESGGVHARRRDIERLRIGLELQFKPYVRKDPDGGEVVAFRFEPVERESKNV